MEKFLNLLFVLLFVFLSGGGAWAQITFCSWNIKDFGKTKSAVEIEFIASTLKDFDVVAIQEVVAGYGGAQAVARLVDELNRKGAKWDYIISDSTKSSPYCTERYAYLWKTSQIKKVQEAWLEQQYEPKIDREPYLLELKYKESTFTLVNFHAVPKNKQPETEIKYFKFLPSQYPDKNLIFLGDFNLPQTHTVFNPLKKMGYQPVFVDQKTTLRMKCSPECLSAEWDNIFYKTTDIKVIKCGVVHFYTSFSTLKEARMISDHLPLWVEVDFEK